MKAISQLVEEALWESLRSLPPKDAIVAFVCTDIVVVDEDRASRIERLFKGRYDVVRVEGWDYSIYHLWLG